jgi:protein gp37
MKTSKGNCTKVFAGCIHVLRRNYDALFMCNGSGKYKNRFALTSLEDTLKDPLLRRRPHTIFMCSISGLFREKVPFLFIDKVLNTIASAPQRWYQLLIKRVGRMAKYFETLNYIG